VAPHHKGAGKAGLEMSLSQLWAIIDTGGNDAMDKKSKSKQSHVSPTADFLSAFPPMGLP
jgi:hypothetical protein